MIFRFLLRRKLFKGQFKLFLLFSKYGLLRNIKTIDRPLNGNFKMHINTNNFIDSCIYYTGDYEPYLKMHYKALIKPNDTVLDVGANIGFHSLYFAELVGKTGRVISFEPIGINFNTFKANLALNDFPQIMANNIALGNENRTIDIHLDKDAENPGAYNLFAEGDKNYRIECVKGDDFLKNNGISHVNFIKIDVEGYEYEVLKGLEQTIRQSRPIINFEYDQNYQLKNNEDPSIIFKFLSLLNYTFFKIDGYGKEEPFTYTKDILGAEVIAKP